MPKNLFANENLVKWCPGCGDYAVLKHTQVALEQIGLKPHQVAIVSGIGCSSRLPHYMNAYGFHTLHGRAPTIVTGLAQTRPDLVTLTITGDGDGLSIGLSHLLHMIRRDINTTVLLLNNKIYGLTKGQNSPTTQAGLKTKMTLHGHQERSLELASLALSAKGTFYGRCYDTQGALLKRLITAGVAHQGCAVIEIYQSCPVFNKSAFIAEDKKNSSHSPLALMWPQEKIAYQEGSLEYVQGQWRSCAHGLYKPSLGALYELLDQEEICPLGLLWHNQSSCTEMPEGKDHLLDIEQSIWPQVISQLAP